jgi:hypothetical protein
MDVRQSRKARDDDDDSVADSKNLCQNSPFLVIGGDYPAATFYCLGGRGEAAVEPGALICTRQLTGRRHLPRKAQK